MGGVVVGRARAAWGRPSCPPRPLIHPNPTQPLISQSFKDINLRELTKKYGRGIGLSLGAVRAYAAQLLAALHHLRTCGVLHAGETGWGEGDGGVCVPLPLRPNCPPTACRLLPTPTQPYPPRPCPHTSP